MTSSNPNYFPKAPSPNTTTLGIKTSTYKGSGDIIQSIATLNKKDIKEIRVLSQVIFQADIGDFSSPFPTF